MIDKELIENAIAEALKTGGDFAKIFVEDKHIGGYVELKALESKGELDTLLKN